MRPFLQLIAETYVRNEHETMADFCFVFPNRRSGTFFRDFLQQVARADDVPMIMPEIVTVNELAAIDSDLTEATRDEALFVLYNCYRSFFTTDDVPDFDKFIFWGTMLLNDFDEIDRNLVDADALFVNLKRWREIRSFYLTEEQVAIIERYWGEKVLSADEVDMFWEHVEKSSRPRGGNAPSNERFIRLWEIMAPLYHRFTESLRESGLATRGMMVRDLAGRLRTGGSANLRASRYIFIGFDIPTAGEVAIFSRLKAAGAADFYWDFNSPVMADRSNRVTRMMLNLRADFPSRYQLDEPEITTFPEIDIIGVPSETGQAKVAGATVARWVTDGSISNPDNAVDTAIVLPDESLFIPVIHSVPESVTTMNVTMGFPLRFTPVASLMTLVTRMHLRSRLSHGSPEYFYEDVETVLAHPVVRSAAPDQCEALAYDIRSNRRYNISGELIASAYPALSPVFAPVPVDESVDTASRYISGLLDFISGAFADRDDMKLERYFVDTCRESLAELRDAVGRFGIGMRESTFLHLLERMLFNATVHFKGEPLQGLQVMGVLETRSLDFDNVIITSMNERIFPKKSYIRSFIPDTLFKCYGLPTPEIAEARYCYYFYRLLGRARRVTLLYDTREGSSRNSEMSRFMTQLLYLYPSSNVTHRAGVYTGLFHNPEPISLPRSPQIRERLQAFLSDGPDRRYLSASALKTYLSCPLQFCLKYLVNLNTEEELTDFMEASTLGQIVHETFETLYGSLRASGEGMVRVTGDTIDRWLKDDHIISRLITRSTNRHYLHRAPEDLDRPLTGEPLVIGQAILHIVRATLRHEKKICPFDYEAGEEKMIVRWPFADGFKANFKQVIDRIDIVNGVRRIVDYKTGNENIDCKDLDAMFRPATDDNQRAIFQVLLYCLLYSVKKGLEDVPMQPYIYTLRTVTTTGLTPMTFKTGERKSKVVIEDFRMLRDEFTSRLNGLLGEIFLSDKPFIQNPSEKACTFCDFKQFCGRE